MRFPVVSFTPATNNIGWTPHAIVCSILILDNKDDYVLK